MNTQEIQTKIEKAQAVIEKKTALIEKRYTAIKKAYDSIADFIGFTEEFEKSLVFATHFKETVAHVWNNHVQEIANKYGNCDNYYTYLVKGQWQTVEDVDYKLWEYVDSIKNSQEAIEEKKKIIANYEHKLTEAQDKEKVLENLPASLKEFMDDWIVTWDAWDKFKRDIVRNAWAQVDEINSKKYKVQYKSPEYIELQKEINAIKEDFSSYEWSELGQLSDNEIHEKNVKASRSLVLDLYNRVCAIVENFDDTGSLKLTHGNEGYAVLNGFVKGTNGKVAKVQSVGAGGWNIQRFHIRTLVHEYKGVIE